MTFYFWVILLRYITTKCLLIAYLTKFEPDIGAPAQNRHFAFVLIFFVTKLQNASLLLILLQKSISKFSPYLTKFEPVTGAVAQN